MMFELRRCRGAAGDESGEARAEYMMFEPAAGVAVRAEGRSPEARPDWISGEARAE
jgi:hypothetical protein